MTQPKILLVGLGGFGKNHLTAWHQMGLGKDLYVAELNPEQHRLCDPFNMPKDHVGTDYQAFLDRVDVVDVVVPTQAHAGLVSAALKAGKDVFVEKPMALTVAESRHLESLAAERSRIVQVGYYYRFHPASRHFKNQIHSGALGDVRYVNGLFHGFKRARTDVGVTHTDAVHFVDLFNWWLAEAPVKVQAVTRDHWGRGMDDLSILLMEYANGAVAKIESGYIQPGKWKDKVVPDAVTTKEAYVCGEKATLEVDFETEISTIHQVKHEVRNGTMWPAMAGSTHPNFPAASPVQMIQAELAAFLEACRTRKPQGPGPLASGVVNARIIEAAYASSKRGEAQRLEWSGSEAGAVAGEGPFN